jgi:hypothetical protein
VSCVARRLVLEQRRSGKYGIHESVARARPGEHPPLATEAAHSTVLLTPASAEYDDRLPVVEAAPEVIELAFAPEKHARLCVGPKVGATPR